MKAYKMNALENFAHKRRLTLPTQNSGAYNLIVALFKGKRLTAIMTATDPEISLMALSQTVGRLKRGGWPIKDERIKTGSRKTIARYWMEVKK